MPNSSHCLSPFLGPFPRAIVVTGLSGFYSEFPLRLSQNRKIFNFIDRHFTVDLGGSLCLFNHKTESIFGYAAIVIERLRDAVVGSRCHLLIDLQPVRYDLNRPGTILRDISIGLDSRLDDPLHFFRLLFNFLYAGRQAAGRVTEKFVGACQDNKTLLPSQKIYWRRTQSSSGQSLAHCSKSRLDHARGQEPYLIVRVHAEMFDDQSADDLNGAAVGVDPNRLTFKLSNRFELGPGDKRDGSARKVAGHNPNRQAANCCGDSGADGSVIVNFSAD